MARAAGFSISASCYEEEAGQMEEIRFCGSLKRRSQGLGN